MNVLRSFYCNYPTVKFAKGETILTQDVVPKFLYAVKSGVVQVTNLTSTGDCRSISFEVADDVMPICWIFSKTTKSLFYYTAYTDCELFVIEKSSFRHQLAHSADFANMMLNRILNVYIGTQLQVDALEKPKAQVKLLYTFRYLCLLYGNDTVNDFVDIRIPLTQQVIANFTGLTRETTSAELNKLKTQQIITCNRKLYKVNTKKLNSLIEDEYNPGISVNRIVDFFSKHEKKSK